MRSVAKLAFLLADWWIGYWGLLAHLRAKGHLITFDRYFHDIMADPKRYRYDAPSALARWVGLLIPRPDLIFVMDAPSAVMWGRKREVPLGETVRQRKIYRELAGATPSCHLVDASKPLGDSVDFVEQTIIRFMVERAAQRLRAESA